MNKIAGLTVSTSWTCLIKNAIIYEIMTEIDNGGAHAIKGFNYQKSVIVLISVLHYLSEDDFEIYVEAKDDIVVKLKNIHTYIQVKGKVLSIGDITRRPDGKDSILEKNHSHGSEHDSYYKIICPSFTKDEKFLEKTHPMIFKKGVDIFNYTQNATDEIIKKLPSVSTAKLINSRIGTTKFQVNIEEGLRYIKGVMVEEEIQVDNNHGMASIEELCLRIDTLSEKVSDKDEDFEDKKFTSKDLVKIFSNTYKAKCFQNILDRLDFTLKKQELVKSKRVGVRALYRSNYSEAVQKLQEINLEETKESEVLQLVLKSVGFNNIDDENIKIAIIVEAYGQLVFESGINNEY